MISLAGIMMMVAGLRFFMPMFGGAKGRRLGWAAVVLVWGMWGATVLESHRATHCQRPVTWDPAHPVVCLGDSLTTGLSDDEAYPAYLQQMLGVPVVNLGRAGITTRDAIHQLPAIVEATPQLVVIELGGNDYLRGYERGAVRDSIVQIIETCRAVGAEVMLVEIPRGFIVDPFSGLERELARTYDLELVPDTAIRMLVLRSPSTPLGSMLAKPYLSDDGLHPNVTGARYLANTIYQRIKRIYGPVVND
jgi:acyl-CoA thioesterase-1